MEENKVEIEVTEEDPIKVEDIGGEPSPADGGKRPKKRAKSEISGKKGMPKPLKIILLIVLFAALALAAYFTASKIKHVWTENQAAKTPPEVRDGTCYFNSLTYRDQILYNNIKDAATANAEKTEVVPYDYDIDTFTSVVKYIMADNPDLFYVDFEGLVLNHGRHKSYVTMAYHATGNELLKMRLDYDTALESAIADVRGGSDFDKELAVHDWLVDNCEYAVGESDRLYNTSYGAVILGKAYCDGYAFAAKAMFDRLGIDSTVVFGNVNDADHVWNMVKIDGAFCHLDVMWDDADLSYGEDMRFHGYFNLTDSEILLDHTWTYGDILPKAEDADDYYTLLGLYSPTVDGCADILTEALVEAAKDKRDYVELFCEETNDNNELKLSFNDAVERANKELGGEIFLSMFRVFPASDKSNAMTIQVFYAADSDNPEAETAAQTTENTDK